MIELMVLLAIIGGVAWAITTYIPMPQPIKGVIIVLAVLFCLVILLKAFGGIEVDVLRY